MSNRDRIARMRDEADASAKEQGRARKPTRFVAVWVIKDGAGEIVATFPYAGKADAEAEAKRLAQENLRDYIVCPHKAPMS